MLLGAKLHVYADHKNLTYKNFTTDRVMRWRLAIEEYGPELVYIKGEKNVVADALSRLSTKEDKLDKVEFISDHFALDDDDLPKNMYPLRFTNIKRCQEKDEKLQEKLQSNSSYSLQPYHGGEEKVIKLITKDDKIVIPEQLQERIVQWYHTFLCHPGETRTESSIRQHFTFKGLQTRVHDICSKCDVCQRTKKGHKKYGHLPPKEAEHIPWDVLCVDLIGPYSVKRKNLKPLTLWCCTMIAPATGWVEIKEIKNKGADEIINVIEIGIDFTLGP